MKLRLIFIGILALIITACHKPAPDWYLKIERNNIMVYLGEKCEINIYAKKIKASFPDELAKGHFIYSLENAPSTLKADFSLNSPGDNALSSMRLEVGLDTPEGYYDAAIKAIDEKGQSLSQPLSIKVIKAPMIANNIKVTAPVPRFCYAQT